MEVEPLEETQLEDLGLNTCNHDIPLSSREVPIFDEPEPQPQPLPNCPPLDASLGNEEGPEPPIKPPSPDSFRIKESDHLTIHTPPSPHVASFHLKDTYCYYHPCIDDPKKYYGFKPGLLGQSRSLGNFSLKTKNNFSQTLETALGLTSDGVVSPGMLYLTRRSLEVLRKFHWMILGGRFNQLSHVSSLLLSKPGEY
ncbi:hypothetical protein Tco_0464257 [Tanacetum coccineum]